MKKFTFLLALVFCLMACHSDLDLDNIDSKAKVEAGIALPIGNYKVTLKNILGDIDDHMQIENEVIVWKGERTETRSFHEINLAENIDTAHCSLDVADQFNKTGIPLPPGITIPIPGSGKPDTLKFDLPLSFTGINNDTDDERLDSVWIKSANFVSKISIENLGLNWNWIKEIKLVFDKHFIFENGDSTQVIYTYGDGGDFGQDIPLIIPDFTLKMEYKEPEKIGSNWKYYVDNKAEFKAYIVYEVPKTENIMLSTSAKVKFDFSTQFIDFKAAWGYFSPSKEMFNEYVYDIGDNLNNIKFIKDSKLPFADPRIHIDIKTQISGELALDSCYVYTQKGTQPRVWALFGDYEDSITTSSLLNFYGKSINPDPKIDPVGKTTHFNVDFDNTKKGGQIHRLFAQIPDKVGFKFNVYFNTYNGARLRVTPNDSIGITANYSLPFRFNEGLFINYPYKFENLNLSQVSLDSLQASSPVIDTIAASNIKVILKAENTIPMHVKLVFTCLDKDGKRVKITRDGVEEDFHLFKDTIKLVAPVMERIPGTTENEWRPAAPSINNIIGSLTREEVELLPTIKTLKMTALVDDQQVYQPGMDHIQLTESQGLDIKIGLSANIDAILNIGANNNK